MIDTLIHRAQLSAQFDHPEDVSSRADTIRAADGNHVLYATIFKKPIGKLAEFGRALGPLNPMHVRAKQFIEQQISIRELRLGSIQQKLGTESRLRRRRCCLPAMIRLRRSGDFSSSIGVGSCARGKRGSLSRCMALFVAATTAEANVQ